MKTGYELGKDAIDLIIDSIRERYLSSGRLYDNLIERITGHSDLYIRDKFETYDRMRHYGK